MLEVYIGVLLQESYVRQNPSLVKYQAKKLPQNVYHMCPL